MAPDFLSPSPHWVVAWSTAFYTLLPRRLVDKVAVDLPPIAMAAHPELLRIFHNTLDGNLERNMDSASATFA